MSFFKTYKAQAAKRGTVFGACFAMQALQVTIPTGVKPGDKFKARVNSDRTVTVTCPPNCAAGTVVRISVPPAKMKVSGGLLLGSSWQRRSCGAPRLRPSHPLHASPRWRVSPPRHQHRTHSSRPRYQSKPHTHNTHTTLSYTTTPPPTEALERQRQHPRRGHLRLEHRTTQAAKDGPRRGPEQRHHDAGRQPR